MTLYRALQPFLLGVYASLAFVLKRLPIVNRKTEKFWKTFDIRYVDGVPAFMKIDRSVFSGNRPVWIHAASGEFEYAKPVIRELAKIGRPVLVTYFSPTFAENVRKFPGVTAACPLPLDSRDELEKFLTYLNPSALLIARTDAWPNTVFATSERKLPCLLFSTTFHDGSNRMRGPGKKLTVDTLKLLDRIQCVSTDDREILESIGVKNSETCGDTRYDQVLERLKTAKQLPEILKQVTDSRAFVAGSVWSEDLQPVLTASVRTYSEFPHTLFLVPHEIGNDFLNEMEGVARSFGIAPQEIVRFTALTGEGSVLNLETKYRVVVVDAVGLLAELYQMGQIAFVGGSFKKTVHSVMEPLAAGALTIVGPFYKNNREAIEFQKITAGAVSNVSFVTSVCNAENFMNVLNDLWQASNAFDFKTCIRDEVAKRGGATAFVMQWLNNRI